MYTPPSNSDPHAPRIAKIHSNSSSSHATAAMSGLDVVASSLSSRRMRFTDAFEVLIVTWVAQNPTCPTYPTTVLPDQSRAQNYVLYNEM